MINRILIRVKVVQMLYSYLISKNYFNIDATATETTRERRFARAVYLDLFLLILRLSGFRISPCARVLPVDKKLAANKVAIALNENDYIRNLILKDPDRIAKYSPVEEALLSEIQQSAAYKDFAKKRTHDIASDAKFWTVILETVIANNPELEALLRTFPDYSLRGFERGVEMVAKAIMDFSESHVSLSNAKTELQKSLAKAYELYLRMFQLILDITAEQNRRLEAAKEKFLATSADLNPNTRLVDNALVEYLNDHDTLQTLLTEYKIVQAEPTDQLVNTLLDRILESELYAKYIETPVSDFASDVEFWREVMRSIVFPSEALAEALEDSSVYWNDDLFSMGTFFLKSLRQIANGNGAQVEILPKYKDVDDEVFGADLFMKAVNNEDLYRSYIERFINTSNWDSKRLAFMDIVILITAIAEIIGYPQIPVAVSVNEYVQIANDYSTEKSGSFINGILFSVITYLNEQGIINKH